MSRQEVDLVMAAVDYADSMFDGAPFAGMTDKDIDRRYSQWIVEFLHDQGYGLVRLEAA